MGLWGSKQKRDITVPNPEAAAQVFVTEEAITNVLKTFQESTNQSKKNIEEPKPAPASLDLHLSPDLHDKRISEYEKGLVEGAKQASKEVEEMFRERYTTMPVCVDLQSRVSKCYSDNSDRTLNCLDVANEFIKCVENERQKKFGLTKA
ncbi:unnamed protein product [Brachionus calyciflorus]|uniref:MICOS complex subunit MIC19 n=1 Tax=Brachionus calyciflorus TaxID=104777 RepID=A0A813W1V0_9BILA|nr:unnamed protein product [Brachionus calyciflorus]